MKLIAILVLTTYGALRAAGAECPALLEAARKAYESREYGAAVNSFQLARQVCPEAAGILLPLAQAQLLAARLEDSLNTLEELLHNQPRNIDGLKLKGDVLYFLGREQEAEQSLLAAVEIDPHHEDSRYALGRIYFQQQRLSEATEIFRLLAERDPNNYRAHDNLALCYAAQQRDKEALTHFLKALDLVHEKHPEYDAVYANFAEFFLEREQFEKAFQLAAEAAERNPAVARNFYLTGKALVRLEKPELAVRWLKQATELDPNLEQAHYNLFQVYRKLGRNEEARQALEAFQESKKTPKALR